MELKLNHRLLTAIENNDIEKVRKCSQKIESNFNYEYVDLAVKMGHIECLQILTNAGWPGVWEGNGLQQAVKQRRTECIDILFDKTSTNGKYVAFHSAIECKNTDFLTMFIPTIPRNSPNWFTVFEKLLENKRLDLVELGLEFCNWHAMLQRNHDKPHTAEYQTVFEHLDSKRQKIKILDNIDTKSASFHLPRKM